MARFTNPDYFGPSCYSYEVRPDRVFIVIDPGLKNQEPVTFEIPLNEIQPAESFLIKKDAEFYLRNQPRIYDDNAPIIIMKSGDFRFKYFVRNGDHQLYALHLAGADTVTVAPYCQPLVELIPYPDNQLELALETHKEGVKEFADFENRLLNTEEYERIMTTRFSLSYY